MIFNRNTGFTAQETALIKKRLNEFEDASFKDTVSGHFIDLDDVSPLTHTVKIKLRSTNLFEPMEGSGSESGVSWTQNLNKTISLRGTSTGEINAVLGRCHLEAGKYYVSDRFDTIGVGVYYNGKWLGDSINKAAFVMPEEGDVEVKLHIPNSTNCEGKTIKPMINTGTIGEPYTPYQAYNPRTWNVSVNEVEYSAEPDGNVYGVESNSPNMSFRTAKGLTMEVTYIHDINAWLHKLKDLVGEL